MPISISRLSKPLAIVVPAVALACFAMSGQAQDRAPGTTPGTAIGTISGTSRVSGGLQIKVRINQSFSSKTAAAGDNWSGVLSQDVISSGKLLVPSGTQVTGIVFLVNSSTKTQQVGELSLKLTSVRGISVNSNEYIQMGKNNALTSAASSTSTPPPGTAAPDRVTNSLVPHTSVGGTSVPNGAAASDPATMEARILTGTILTFATE